MDNKAGRTEHAGTKRGKSAYYGKKPEAKRESRKERRRWDKKEPGYERTED